MGCGGMRSLQFGRDDSILVAGAGGFIGGHVLAHFHRLGVRNLRGADIKPLGRWFQRIDGADNRVLDLRRIEDCRAATKGMDYVFNFACDMGGMGFIESHKAECMLSVLINTHMLMAAREAGVKRYLYSSSACVYNADKQVEAEVTALKEADAYPAMPEDGYGWEKLFSERMCRHFAEDFELETRIVRFHNVYGPWGTYDGGREKAPAAICRKVIAAKLKGEHEIEIWGDGRQTRSFMFIDDCLKGVIGIMLSDWAEPINVGSSELVSINQLVDMVESIANITLKRHYNLAAPKGVRGRNSDNTLIRQVLNWEPSTRLIDGLRETYAWVETMMTGGDLKNRFTV